MAKTKDALNLIEKAINNLNGFDLPQKPEESSDVKKMREHIKALADMPLLESVKEKAIKDLQDQIDAEAEDVEEWNQFKDEAVKMLQMLIEQANALLAVFGEETDKGKKKKKSGKVRNAGKEYPEVFQEGVYKIEEDSDLKERYGRSRRQVQFLQALWFAQNDSDQTSGLNQVTAEDIVKVLTTHVDIDIDVDSLPSRISQSLGKWNDVAKTKNPEDKRQALFTYTGPVVSKKQQAQDSVDKGETVKTRKNGKKDNRMELVEALEGLTEKGIVDAHTVKELHTICDALNLPKGGTKSELSKRIHTAVN